MYRPFHPILYTLFSLFQLSVYHLVKTVAHAQRPTLVHVRHRGLARHALHVSLIDSNNIHIDIWIYLLQLFVLQLVKIVAHVAPPILALVHHHGLVQHALHVSRINQINIYFLYHFLRLQPSVYHPVKIVVHAQLPILVHAHHHGLAQHALHVSLTSLNHVYKLVY